MLKKIFGKKRILLILDFILLIIFVNTYFYIYNMEKTKNTFETEAIKFVEENENPVFKINKIILYSSAHAVDNSEERKMEDIDISQFTDMAIYINNKARISELTAENTINEMYIDNINISLDSQTGEHIFNSKNANDFGKFVDLENHQGEEIVFDIVNTNNEQIEDGYEASSFFTDCSNPISLGFVNKNLLTNCTIGNVNGEVVFDGSILKNANIDLESISSKISFSVHIKNNLNERFVCNLEIDNVLENVENGIYSGYVMKVQNTAESKYNFLKVSE